MIIGLCGYKGSGKTTITSYLKNRVISFSDPIMKMLESFGIPNDVLYNKARWDEPLDILCGKTTRHAAQTLGTEWGRICIGQNVWTDRGIELAKEKLKIYDIAIIENVRFINEASTILSNNGTLIAFDRFDMKLDKSHVSEQEIDHIQKKMCEHFFVNHGLIEHSMERFDKLLNTIKFSK